MLPKVSVIVPIYKVEIYLDRCVDSILNQSYSNIEVILVNDGSPDNCGKMINEYAKKDTRVKPFHKQNGGLSDARNYGMNYITGEYTLFVDSDDWIDINMVEDMVTNSLTFKADVVQTAFYYAYEDHLLFDNRYYLQEDPPIILDNIQVMSELVINERIKNFAWGKLYKTSLVKDIPFKKGVLFEDVFWAHRVMSLVNTYVMLHRPRCYYYQREDSIVATYTPRNLDILKGLKKRHCFIEEFYEHLVDESYKVILKTSLQHYNLLLANRHKDIGGLYRKDIKLYIKNNYEKLKQAAEDDKPLRTQLLMFRVSPLLNILHLIIRRVLSKLNLVSSRPRLSRIDL